MKNVKFIYPVIKGQDKYFDQVKNVDFAETSLTERLKFFSVLLFGPSLRLGIEITLHRYMFVPDCILKLNQQVKTANISPASI